MSRSGRPTLPTRPHRPTSRSTGAATTTLLILLSDNGASREGGKHGTLNELGFFNLLGSPADEMVARVDEVGGPFLYNNYPWGWSQVGNTPLRFYKSNTYEGGIRDPLIVHWPNGIAARGGIRDQYHHVSDVWPTIMECVGIEAPDAVKGVAQQPIEGIGFRYSFDSADTPTRKTTQYYEMVGHRAIWYGGWKAVTMHTSGNGPFPFEGALHWVEYELQDDRDDLVRAAEVELENQLADQ